VVACWGRCGVVADVAALAWRAVRIGAGCP
jgi:hypothetical protein